MVTFSCESFYNKLLLFSLPGNNVDAILIFFCSHQLCAEIPNCKIHTGKSQCNKQIFILISEFVQLFSLLARF